jgi:hypothetical protein
LDIIYSTLLDIRAALKKQDKNDYLIKNLLMHFFNYYFLTWPEFKPEEKDELRRNGLRLIGLFEKTLTQKLEAGGYLNELTQETLRELVTEAQKTLEDGEDPDDLHATDTR